MHAIDWALIFIPLLVILGFAFYTKRLLKSVVDYTSAGRCAGRYLMCNARAEADSGVSNMVGTFQQIMVAGFVLNWWGALSAPLFLVIGIIGFVTYRYRETRVLTLPQLFEVRYSRNFRLFMGALAFVAGSLNYGVFPAIASKFFVYFLQLPLTAQPIDSLPPFRTDVLIMAGYLTFTLVVMLMGGQISLMVTDCVEGIFSHLVYIVIVIVLLWMVPWAKIEQWLASAPPDHSMVNPFDAMGVKDFNIWMWAIGLFVGVYITMAWQNRSGFNAAGRNAHETRMGGVLGNWRGYARILMLTVLAVCAMTYLNHSDFKDLSAAAWTDINKITDAQQKSQATVTIALSHLLPMGLKGLFVLVMILGMMAAEASHMHSWGSIFVQDVVMPLRKTPLPPRQHIWVIRCAQIGVGAFALIFSTFFTQTDYIFMWWAITGTVFQAGAGAAIIGGLYWKKGTTAAAWTGALLGSTLSLGAILVSQYWSANWWGFKMLLPVAGWLGISLPEKFFNGVVITFWVDVLVLVSYIVVSLLTCRGNFDMDRLLHRGRHRVEQDVIADRGMLEKGRFHWSKLLGFDEHFTLGDKIIAGGIFWWTIFWAAVVLISTTWNLWHPLCAKLGLAGAAIDCIDPWPTSWWTNFWLIQGIILPFVISAVTLVWFSIGGVKDLRDFFIALRTDKRDHTDDGRVVTTPEDLRPAGSAEPADADLTAPAQAARTNR
jgi:SSS family solute:Na+ symporter